MRTTARTICIFVLGTTLALGAVVGLAPSSEHTDRGRTHPPAVHQVVAP